MENIQALSEETNVLGHIFTSDEVKSSSIFSLTRLTGLLLVIRPRLISKWNLPLFGYTTMKKEEEGRFNVLSLGLNTCSAVSSSVCH